MNRKTLTGAATSIALLCSSLAVAQKAPENGNWRAASTTARSITGDVAFSRDKISINFYSTPLAQIRTLQPAEVDALFGAEDAAATGNLYRISVPVTKTFLHHSPLCGGDEADWVAAYVSGHTLHLAFLSNPKIPTLTADALASGINLCGTFAYVR